MMMMMKKILVKEYIQMMEWMMTGTIEEEEEVEAEEEVEQEMLEELIEEEILVMRKSTLIMNITDIQIMHWKYMKLTGNFN